jgi:hypothetical protein
MCRFQNLRHGSKKNASARREKRRPSPSYSKSGALSIRTSPDSKPPRKAGIDNSSSGNTTSTVPQTILDYLDFLYQPLQPSPGTQFESRRSIGTFTKSASNSWSWRDIKHVDQIKSARVSTETYLEKFLPICSLTLQSYDPISPPRCLPDIDLCIASEKHLEMYLHKSVIERVNMALQIIYNIGQDDSHELGLYSLLPNLIQQPVYSRGYDPDPRRWAMP